MPDIPPPLVAERPQAPGATPRVDLPRFGRRPAASRVRALVARARLRRGVAASILLHLALVALLVVANLQRQGRQEATPAEAPPFEVAFEGPHPERPGIPDELPPQEEAPRAGERPVPPPSAPPAPQPVPTPPQPTPPQPAPAQPQQAQPAAPTQPAPLSPAPSLPPLPRAADALPLPPPPTRTPAPTPPRPQPPPRPPEPQRPPAPFPPLDFGSRPNYGPPPAPSGTSGGTGRADPGRGLDAQIQTSRDLGDDWIRQFRNWVDLHKRYPRGAAELGEQGMVTVRFLVAKDGTIRNISMVRRAPFESLNFALTNLFRPGTRLPTLPADASEEGETITFTMRYIIIDR